MKGLTRRSAFPSVASAPTPGNFTYRKGPLMPSSVTEDVTRLHRSLMGMTKDRPEYQPGQESALYGYSEGVEHGIEALIASGYQKVEYARTVEDLQALPAGVSIFDNAAVFTVSAAAPSAARTWVGPDGTWFPEAADAAASHLPAMVMRPAPRAAVLAITAAELTQ